MAASANTRLRLEAAHLTARFGQHRAVRDVSLLFPAHTVTAIIGPSGCGKSTLLRCLNRMHELTPGASVQGEVLLDNVNIYAADVSPIELRRRIGMVFQRPTPFPTMSISDNVAAGLRVNGRRSRAEVDDAVSRALQQAALWDEVKDRLHTSALDLSGGQQQRLCIARALAPQPEILLLDEPTASLDPAGTQRIEELCHALKRLYTIVIVTHNMQQAARVSDHTAFMYLGSLIEVGKTNEIFTKPKVEQTEVYHRAVWMSQTTVLESRTYNFWYGPNHALHDISVSIPANAITALIGPSGCGKTTFLRSINRMHDLTPGARHTGEILLGGGSIFAPGTDVVALRRRVGMVFQRPNPFPKPVYDNVAYGPRLNTLAPARELPDRVEHALRQAALWDEVSDRLREPGTSLSGGQQQRLCIARALANEPEVLLMDEPCSALDPIATQQIEELLVELKQSYTIVIVTHNMQQAARVSDFTGVFYVGHLVEFGTTQQVFTRPTDERTEAYITGRFG